MSSLVVFSRSKESRLSLFRMDSTSAMRAEKES